MNRHRQAKTASRTIPIVWGSQAWVVRVVFQPVAEGGGVKSPRLARRIATHAADRCCAFPPKSHHEGRVNRGAIASSARLQIIVRTDRSPYVRRVMDLRSGTLGSWKAPSQRSTLN